MSRQEPRVKWYFALAFAVGTLTVVAFIYDDFNYYCFEMQVVFYSIHSVYITSYVLCTLYICRQLNKGGLNSQYRKLTMRRHFSYVSLMLVCSSTTVLDYMNITGLISLGLGVQTLLAVYYVGVPFAYALIRLSEPAVFATVKR